MKTPTPVTLAKVEHAGEMPDLPAGLDRRGEAKPEAAPAKPARAKPAKGAFKSPTPAKPAKPARAKPTQATKPAKPAKATPAHKPSQIERTEANPARSIVPATFKQRYAQHNDSNGDRVAYALAAYVHATNEHGRPSTDLAKLREVAEANGVDFRRYADLNVGQQRMNVGNRLRGLLKAGKAVTIGKQRFADAAKALQVVEQVKPEPKAKKVA